MSLSKQLRVAPGKRAGLADRDPADTHGLKKGDAADQALARNVARLEELQFLMYAEQRRSLLVVLQGTDASGKDGAIRHVIRAFNPQSCRVTSFKAPTSEELAHDFLWRVHAVAPRKGEVAVFNRSHYEDVLIVRVMDLVPKNIWAKRYEQINRFEHHLAEHDVVIVKFFLHVSKDEQRERLEARFHDPTRQWKVSLGDLDQRKKWDDYMEAYEDALSKCSKAHAPWYVIPADKKWFRNVAVSEILVDTLEGLKMKFPKPKEDYSKIKVE